MQSRLPFNVRLFAVSAIGFLIAVPCAHAAIGLIGTVHVGMDPGPVAVIPSVHRAFVVNRKDATVSVVSTEGLGIQKVIPVGKAPISIAVEPVLGMTYVANSGDGTVSAITNGLVVSTWTVGGSPIAVVVDSVLRKLYVADAALQRVDVLNARTGAVIATIPTGHPPTAMALNIATHNLFVALGGTPGSVVVIHGQTDAVAKTVGALPAGLQSIAVDYATNVAVVVSPSANAHVAIDAGNAYAVTLYNPTIPCGPGVVNCHPDPVTPSVIADLPGFYFLEGNALGASIVDGATGGYPFGDYWGVHLGVNGGTTTGQPVSASAFAFNPLTLQAAAGDTIVDLYFDPTSTSAYHELKIDPAGLAFDPLAARLVATDSVNNTLTVFSTSPETAVPTTDIGIGNFMMTNTYADTNPATGIAYALRDNFLYAINEAQAAAGAGGTSNTAGVTAIQMASVGSAGIAVNPATNRIYAANSGLYEINGSTNTSALVPTMPAAAISIAAVAIDSGQNRVLALNSETFTNLPNALYILDGASDAVLKVVQLDNSALETGPNPLLVDPARSLAYAVGGSVYVIDTAAGALVATIPLPSVPVSAALNPLVSRLYVTTTTGGIVVIDTVQNSIAQTISVPSSYNLVSVGVNPPTGRFYVGADTAAGGFMPHVLVYASATNALIADLSGKDHPAIIGDASILDNSLTNTIYVGSSQGTSAAAMAAIDGETDGVSAVPPSQQEATAYALSLDLASGVLAAAGHDYTNLFFPTSNLDGGYRIPITVAVTAAPDTASIATAPILRTHNTRPTFNLSVTSGFKQPAATLAPQSAFYQVDGWRGNWTAAALKATPGSLTATSQIKVATPLKPGRHILYTFGTFGDAATVQNDFSGGSSSMSGPLTATVFTVER